MYITYTYNCWCKKRACVHLKMKAFIKALHLILFMLLMEANWQGFPHTEFFRGKEKMACAAAKVEQQ